MRICGVELYKECVRITVSSTSTFVVKSEHGLYTNSGCMYYGDRVEGGIVINTVGLTVVIDLLLYCYFPYQF